MAGQARTKNRDAGGATGSSPSSSPARGLSVVDGARQPTAAEAGLIERLEGLTGKVEYGPRCGVAMAFRNMSPEIRAKVEWFIDESDVPVTKIANVLDEFGYPDLYRSVTRHRRRKTSPATGCRCE